MIAFVLSGGGSRGALQVGALRALMEQGIKPRMLIGTSVGGLNAVYLGVDPSLERIEKLSALWRRTRKIDIYPDNRFQVAWRVLTGQGSLYSNTSFQRFLERYLTSEAETFADLAIPCYVTATHLDTYAMRVLGEQPSDKTIDALMATTAIPPMHPPYRLDDGEYVDGAAVALLPLEVALKHGATEVYALHIVDGPTPPLGRRTILNVSGKAIGALVQRQWQDSVIRVAQARVKLHHIQLNPTCACPMWDYSQTDTHIQAGYEQTLVYLAQVQPELPWPNRVWHRLSDTVTQRSWRRTSPPSPLR